MIETQYVLLSDFFSFFADESTSFDMYRILRLTRGHDLMNALFGLIDNKDP